MQRQLFPLVFFTAALLSSSCSQDSGPPTASVERDEAFSAAIRERVARLDPREHGIGRRVPDLAFTDVDDEPGKLSDFADAKGLAILVRDVGCPVSKRQGPTIARLEEELTKAGFAFLYVNMSEHNTVEEMRGEIADFGFESRYVVDRDQAFGHTLGVRTTTDAFVVDSALTLVYRGAIDDRHARGTSFTEAKNEFLRDALTAVSTRRAVKVTATSAPGCFVDLDGTPPPELEREITYHDQVARILQRNCVDCHRDGGAGPFPLETYKQARGRKGMVRYVVEHEVMPPWFAAEGTGPWENDRRLSGDDKQALLDWYAAGCPEGDPEDAPALLTYAEGWLIGEPEEIFPFTGFDVPAEGVVDLQRLISERLVPRDIWVQALQILPGHAEVVHHATVMYRPPHGSDLPGNREGWQFLFGYLPGKGPRVYDHDVARFIPKDSQIRIEMHYTPSGIAVTDQTRLGFVLADGPPRFVAQSRLLRNLDIRIPAGESDVRFQIDTTVPTKVLLRSLTPHMHLLGRTFDVDLIQPDGTTERVLTVPAWDPNWQFSYVFRDKPLVQAGARILVTASFDNSSDNPNNEFPGRDVIDGPQIWDEMLILAAEWISPRDDGQL